MKRTHKMNAQALVLTCLVVGFLASPTMARPTRSSKTQTGESRIEELLRQSGYSVKKVKTNSWFIERAGQIKPTIRILIGASNTSLAIGAVVVSKRNLRLSTDAGYKMLKLSYDLNYVRVCIDSDDDLIVMSQVKVAWLNLQELKDTIERVATAADRAYGEMRPFITP